MKFEDKMNKDKPSKYMDGTDVMYTVENVSYKDAVKNTPKGYKMISIAMFGTLMQNTPCDNLDFYFWLENPKWNTKYWRPVARGGGCYFFGLFAISSNLRASRGVYIKVK